MQDESQEIDDSRDDATEALEECVICLDNINQPPPSATISLPCKHTFHWSCLKKNILANGERSTCPLCREQLTVHTVNVTRTSDTQHYPRVALALHTDPHTDPPNHLFILTLQTMDSKGGNTKLYADSIIVEKDVASIPSTDPMFLTIAPVYTTHRRQQVYQEENSISCCCRCVLFTMNRCCECLAVGLIVGVTYSMIYIIKHVVHHST